jgi:hypothetical protein
MQLNKLMSIVGTFKDVFILQDKLRTAFFALG